MPVIYQHEDGLPYEKEKPDIGHSIQPGARILSSSYIEHAGQSRYDYEHQVDNIANKQRQQLLPAVVAEFCESCHSFGHFLIGRILFFRLFYSNRRAIMIAMKNI